MFVVWLSFTALINLGSNFFSVGWMNLSLRNASSTLKNNLRAVKSARPWKSSFHSGICSTDNTGCIAPQLYSYLTYFVLLSSSGELVQIMMATANENLSAKFCNRVLKFFTKLFQLSKSTAVILIVKKMLSKDWGMLQMDLFVQIVVWANGEVLRAVPNGHIWRQSEKPPFKEGVRDENWIDGNRAIAFQTVSPQKLAWCFTQLYTKSDGSTCVKDEKKQAWERSSTLAYLLLHTWLIATEIGSTFMITCLGSYCGLWDWCWKAVEEWGSGTIQRSNKHIWSILMP